MLPAQKWGATNSITRHTNPAGSEFCFRLRANEKGAQLWRVHAQCPTSGYDRSPFLSEAGLCSQGRGPKTKLQLGREGLGTSITCLCPWGRGTLARF